MKQFRVLVRICIHSRAWTTSGTAWRGNEGPSWPAAQHIGAGSEACPSLLRNLALLVGFWFCSSHDGDGAVIRDAVVTRHPPLRQAPMTERAAVERCKWRNDAGRSTPVDVALFRPTADGPGELSTWVLPQQPEVPARAFSCPFLSSHGAACRYRK